LTEFLGALLLIAVVVGLLRQFQRGIRLMAGDPDSRALLAAVVAMLLGGAFFFHDVEGWPYLDALYYCVVTLTTVGYGDLVPRTAAGRLFAIPYILLGLGLVASFVATVARRLLEQRQQGRGQQVRPADDPSSADQ